MLPSIRKTGGYIAANPEDTDEQIMARGLMAANRALSKVRGQLADSRKRVALLEPKAQYCDEVLRSETTYTPTQVAKAENISSGRKLMLILNALGVVYRQSGQWLPMAKYTDKGYFAMRTAVFHGSDGQPFTRTALVITEKGRQFIHDLLGKIERN